MFTILKGQKNIYNFLTERGIEFLFKGKLINMYGAQEKVALGYWAPNGLISKSGRKQNPNSTSGLKTPTNNGLFSSTFGYDAI